MSNAERRAIASGENVAVPRVADIYAAMPSITGKFELEYEGELRGAETVAKDLIRAAVLNVSAGYFRDHDARAVVRWFDAGGNLQMSDTTPARELVDQTRDVAGLHDAARHIGDPSTAEPELASAHRLRARSPLRAEEDQPQRRLALLGQRLGDGTPAVGGHSRRTPDLEDDEIPMQGGKKKYYN